MLNKLNKEKIDILNVIIEHLKNIKKILNPNETCLFHV